MAQAEVPSLTKTKPLNWGKDDPEKGITFVDAEDLVLNLETKQELGLAHLTGAQTSHSSPHLQKGMARPALAAYALQLQVEQEQKVPKDCKCTHI